MEYDSDEQRAHHEAGHAVAAWAVHGVNVASISLVPDGDSAARCNYSGAPTSPLGDLLITGAGPEVDNLTIGEGAGLNPGAMSDIHRFNEALERMGLDTNRPMDEKYCRTVERADRVLRRFVSRHLPLIQKVAATLLARRELTGEELRQLLPAELENTLYAPKARPQRHDPKQGRLFGEG